MREEHDAKSHDFIILNIVCKIKKSKIVNITYAKTKVKLSIIY